MIIRRLLPMLVLAAPLPAPLAAAETMRVIESSPRAASMMDGARQEIRVRFNHPVDHNGSRLMVVQDGRVVRTLRPRLGASPDTLYAVAGSLAPGTYVLRWAVKSRRDGGMTDGGFEFMVGR